MGGIVRAGLRIEQRTIFEVAALVETLSDQRDKQKARKRS
jgi:hypothetical protein